MADSVYTRGWSDGNGELGLLFRLLGVLLESWTHLVRIVLFLGGEGLVPFGNSMGFDLNSCSVGKMIIDRPSVRQSEKNRRGCQCSTSILCESYRT